MIGRAKKSFFPSLQSENVSKLSDQFKNEGSNFSRWSIELQIFQEYFDVWNASFNNRKVDQM